MDQYFERIQQLLSRTDFPARIRFMIEDVIDLRNAKVDFQVHQLNFDCELLLFYFFITHHTASCMIHQGIRRKNIFIFTFILLKYYNVKLNHKL